ncbi:TrmH family RNA methyltransferase [Endomicrobium proavitum]|uniref:23S rRNA (Guanosine-2-O-)-methyltransferase n=1 Tax=Endomicrobium proavitum TaxID=1408281 RepID=A0A0G3WK87_9BACT|nr:RNA methyltransferase [Endomicrobium proavitum]AKL98718.1 23S rRNA (Guanosine-2-O-)-methyltransferase [Endomicrobium proavitum]
MFIESQHNNLFKELFALRDKKNRDASGLFLVEGQKQVLEIPKDRNIKYIIVSESYNGNVPEGKVVTVSDRLFSKLAFTKTPQGIAAAVEKKEFDAAKIIKQNGFFVILENISDPGNLGTIIRSAHAFGAKAVFISKESADVYSDKTIRSSMGSIFHIPVIDNANLNDIIKLLKQEKVLIAATSPKAKKSLDGAIFTKKFAFIVGNESNGISAQIQKTADVLIKIEMPGKAESLNAAAAAAIIMYEASKKP